MCTGVLPAGERFGSCSTSYCERTNLVLHTPHATKTHHAAQNVTTTTRGTCIASETMLLYTPTLVALSVAAKSRNIGLILGRARNNAALGVRLADLSTGKLGNVARGN